MERDRSSTQPSSTQPSSPGESEMERLASRQDPGLLAETWEFLRQESKWWLIPIVVVLLVLGVLAFLSTSALAPFIYPIF